MKFTGLNTSDGNSKRISLGLKTISLLILLYKLFYNVVLTTDFYFDYNKRTQCCIFSLSSPHREHMSFSNKPFLLAHHRWASRVGCAPSSVVHRPSTFAFKPHLLWNLWANFNETWQKVSPMGRDYNLHKRRALVHWVNFGQAEQMCNCEYIAICLKRHLLWSYLANFNETV